MKKTITYLILALSLLMTSCSSNAVRTEVTDADQPKTPHALQPTAVSTALFQIIKADGTSFDVTLEALKTLPLAQVTADGKVEEGPYLSDILALAGVTEFTEITLNGSSSPVTLTFEQVDKNTILDFNNHGTLKLYSTYIPKAQWTKDVSEITVK